PGSSPPAPGPPGSSPSSSSPPGSSPPPSRPPGSTPPSSSPPPPSNRPLSGSPPSANPPSPSGPPSPSSPRPAPPPRERAVLDSAHAGAIHAAFGTIGQHEAAHHGLRARTLALLAIVGPGLIVMVGDNDAGGVATYSEAGQNYG